MNIHICQLEIGHSFGVIGQLFELAMVISSLYPFHIGIINQGIYLFTYLLRSDEYRSFILDEPTVGLDPKQIIEIRTLIRKLGKNHTVILSSHILSEVQAVCDKIIVINEGKVVANDTEEHLSQKLSGEHKLTAKIQGDKDKIVRAMQGIKGVEKVICDASHKDGVNDIRIEAKEGVDIRRDVFETVVKNGWYMLELKTSELSLEDIFLKLTMGEALPALENTSDKEGND